ncbi:MAG: beta-galactosidase [Armatimonadota bacterium]
MDRCIVLAFIWICLGALGGHAADLVAEVTEHHGSPMLHINGRPACPLMFFGHPSSGPTVVEIGTQWQQYHSTFVAPEDNEGRAGIHFRVGGDGPGTVWVDDVRLYPGPQVDEPQENLVRHGDWEAAREEIEQDWTLYQAPQANARAQWALDPSTSVSGQQSLRIDIENAGSSRMHLHFYQSGHTVRRGETYTYSLWMKADRPRTVDFMALHIGPPWTIYGAESTHYTRQARMARDAGVHIYSFGIPMPWPRPGEEPDFHAVDLAFERTLRIDPEALCLPRFGTGPPSWWLEEHPDHRLLFDDGSTTGWTMASEAWRQEMQPHLRALVRHCEERYGDHVLGYHPCGQNTGEWFYFNSWHPRFSGFSPPMNEGFRRWLREKYGTIEALREAWGRPDVSFDAIEVPTAEQRAATGDGMFRDPAAERHVIDWFEYKQVAMERPLRTMARIIKEETQRRKLVVLFYGYTFDMSGLPHGPQISGHLAMRELLACPDVDILCSPISYFDRGLGGSGPFMSAVDSVRAAGKLWLNEDDTRTHLADEDAGFGRVDSPQASRWVHRRNFGQLLPRRLACWYMDLANAGWLEGEDLWENIGGLRRIYERELDEPARWQPEVALILDEVSPLYSRCSHELHRPLVSSMRAPVYRCGAPFRIHLLSDLVAGRVPPVRAYIFLNCFRLTDRQRAAIARETRGRAAIWLYGSGYLNETGDAANIAALTGIGVEDTEPQAGWIQPEAGSPLVEGIDEPFGTETQLDPLWRVSDPGVEVIGRYGDDSIAAAAEDTADGLRVYIGGLHCPARLLRNVLRRAGVHLWVDSDDIVLTDGRFLALTASEAGHKSLHLDRRCDVTDAMSGEPVAQGVEALDLHMQLGETRLFMLR